MSSDKQVNLSKEAENDSVPGRGLYGNRSLEKIPQWDPTGSETVIDNLTKNTNSFIVLGNDRDSSKASGKGGPGYTQCGKIDIVVGLASSERLYETKKRNPNFANDAARVYLSQKSNIDKYFGIVQGSETQSSNDKSSVGIKADHVRMVARNSIKIVTGAFRGNPAEKDSQGKEMTTAGTIDFLAGNSNNEQVIFDAGLPITVNSLQPLIKGDNLEHMLKDMIELLSDIQNQVFANKKALLELALNYQTHIHISPFFGAPVPPSPMALGVAHTVANLFTDLPSSFTIETNLASLSENYLNPNLALYIKSKSVNTT